VLHTPAWVHRGTATGIRAQQQHTLDAVHAAHSERVGNRRPQAPELPKAALHQPDLAHPIRQGDEFSSRRKSTP
jgi:putative transposase